VGQFVHQQRGGGLGADKGNFDGQGDLYLVSVFQRQAGVLDLPPVDPGSVLAVKVFQVVHIPVAEDADMLTRDLAFGQYQIALPPTPDDHFILANRPTLAGFFALVDDENGSVKSV